MKRILLSKKVHCGRFTAWTDERTPDVLHLGIVGADAGFVPCEPCLDAIKAAVTEMGYPYSIIGDAIGKF